MLEMIFPFILKLIGYFIDKGISQGKIKEDARASYLAFISNIEPSLSDSARLRTSAQDQLKRLQEQMKNID